MTVKWREGVIVPVCMFNKPLPAPSQGRESHSADALFQSFEHP